MHPIEMGGATLRTSGHGILSRGGARILPRPCPVNDLTNKESTVVMRGFAQRSEPSANGAEYDSQGQARSASPLVAITAFEMRPEGPRYRSQLRPFRARIWGLFG